MQTEAGPVIDGHTGPTWRPFWRGARDIWIFIPSVSIFAVAFGTVASQKGLSLAEAVAMSAVVYAGVSQLVGLEVWRDTWTWSAYPALALIICTINSRLLLMSASLRPWLHKVPAPVIYPALATMTDVNWAMGIKYHATGGRDFGYFLGGGIAMWLIWVLVTIPGYLVTGLITDPKRFGLDLIMLIVFAAMAVPVLRRSHHWLPFIVAGAVGVAFSYVVPGFWFIIAGALAGAFAAAAMPVKAQAA
jgi:predicted branched-subunit amino acid permease